MPIARVTTNIRDLELRRGLAEAGTEVFRHLGLADEHITTVFTDLTGNDLFVGETAFEERHPGELFVLVTVAMGSKRGADVRSLLAHAYTVAVEGVVAAQDVCVEYVVRDGRDVYVGGIPLGTATAGVAMPQRPAEDYDIDQGLRSVLEKLWNVGYTGWDPATPLAALRDDAVDWDSLAAAELAVIIENNLPLARDLDVGEEEFRRGLGFEATYDDLLKLVAGCA